MSTMSLQLDARERDYLADLLDTDLKETRVELRRSAEPDFRDELRGRENLIRGLLQKLGVDTPAVGAGSPS